MSGFVITRSVNRQANAVHTPSGISVHSTIDPELEARRAAELLARQFKSVLLIGNGLGYLANELSKLKALSASVEVFSSLAELCNESAVYRAEMVIRNHDELAELFNTHLPASRLVVMPYVRSLSRYLELNIRELMNSAYVNVVSREVYNPILNENMAANSQMFQSIKRFDALEHRTVRIPIAVGSGPSLSASIDCLKEYRSEIIIVAASGAVPVLRQSCTKADFIVAMEARRSVIDDLEAAEGTEWTIVFPWTHPHVLRTLHLPFLAVDEGHEVFTHGGATGLAAADIASRLGKVPAYLIGMDMSDSAGEYSAGVNRTGANISINAPKFDFMRSAARAWTSESGRQFKHVVMPGVDRIQGFKQVYPIELRTEFERDLCRHELIPLNHD